MQVSELIALNTQVLTAAFLLSVIFGAITQRTHFCTMGAISDVVNMGDWQQGLKGATRTRHIEEIRGEFVAIDRALERLQPGDLCLVLVDQVEEALAHLNQRVREA